MEINPDNIVMRTHTKTIYPTLLHEEFKVVFGDKFVGIWTFPDDVFKLLFNGALTPEEDSNQNQIITDHVPSSDLAIQKTMQDQKCAEGFDLYKDIIAHINNGGGFSSVDEGRTAYKMFLSPVRNMLKDGFPEFAYREIQIVISPAGLFLPEQIDLYKGWIKEFGMKYMTPAVVFDLLDTKPEGEI